MSATFVARYRSACSACEAWVMPGQCAHYVDGEVEHVECETQRAEWQGRPCGACFQVPSVNGACGCEDLSPEWTI